mgnify:CR=1 FL=1
MYTHVIFFSHTIFQHWIQHLINVAFLGYAFLGYAFLGYAFLDKEPDSQLACDDPTCEVAVDEQDIIRLNCDHTFHRGCFLTESSDQEHSYAFPRDEMKCTVCFATSLTRFT